MLFEIERTSDFYNEFCPCDNAKIIDTDQDTKEDTWGIEINTIENLMDFVKANGQIIVSSYHKTNKAIGTIEIYDKLRE